MVRNKTGQQMLENAPIIDKEALLRACEQLSQSKTQNMITTLFGTPVVENNFVPENKIVIVPNGTMYASRSTLSLELHDLVKASVIRLNWDNTLQDMIQGGIPRQPDDMMDALAYAAAGKLPNKEKADDIWEEEMNACLI